MEAAGGTAPLLSETNMAALNQVKAFVHRNLGVALGGAPGLPAAELGGRAGASRSALWRRAKAGAIVGGVAAGCVGCVTLLVVAIDTI